MNDATKQEQHTPGPWTWTPKTGEHPTSADLHPAAYSMGEGDSILHHGGDWPMREADARLIAAAPDLADALADVREALIIRRQPQATRLTAEEEEEILEAASEALVKAAGHFWWKHLGDL